MSFLDDKRAYLRGGKFKEVIDREDVTEFTMAIVYSGMVAASVFLFRRAPDSAQRIAMLILAVGFIVQILTMIAAGLNDYDHDLRAFLWFMRRTARDLIQIGVFVILLRLVWKEWVRGPLKHS